MKKNSITIIISIIVFSFLFVAISVFFLDRDDEVELPLKIEVFLDLNDTKSKEIFETTQSLKNKYEGNIDINYYHTNKTGNAYNAYAAYVLTKKSLKGDEYLSKLYDNQYKYEKSALVMYATEIGINEEEFNQNLFSNENLNSVEQELEVTKQLGIRSTPLIYINNRKIVVENRDDFVESVNQILED